MQLFRLNELGQYTYTTRQEGVPNEQHWPARLGTIVNLTNPDEHYIYESDSDDEKVITAADIFMRFVHLFGHSGSRFRFTGLFPDIEPITNDIHRMVRFFDEQRMIEVHVWPTKHPQLIQIFHFDSNMEYEIRLKENFR
jgi:hypothetical protein